MILTYNRLRFFSKYITVHAPYGRFADILCILRSLNRKEFYSKKEKFIFKSVMMQHISAKCP